jgi:hypothetical protein
MKTARRPRLPNTQTREERALWQSIRAQLSERRRQKREQYGLASNRGADLYIPMIVRNAAEQNSVAAIAQSSKIIPFRKL